MKNIIGIFAVILMLSIVFFSFQDKILFLLEGLKREAIPCEEPIKYSIGFFDERFNLSKEEFISIVSIAENTWEDSIGKQLFTYVPDGKDVLKINLIYDSRQEASQRLKDAGISVNNSKSSYNDLKASYGGMQADYLSLKKELEARIIVFKNNQNSYKKEVASLNASGGASREDFNRLNKEKKSLDLEFLEINKLQTELNTKAADINALVVVLNQMVSSLNLEVKKFNTIGSELGGEFEEGTYKQDSTGRQIDIYQFDTKGKLARVLAHEFGHALGLEHLEDSKAVMYRLNNGINEKLTIDDIVALKNLCTVVTQ